MFCVNLQIGEFANFKISLSFKLCRNCFGDGTVPSRTINATTPPLSPGHHTIPSFVSLYFWFYSPTILFSPKQYFNARYGASQLSCSEFDVSSQSTVQRTQNPMWTVTQLSLFPRVILLNEQVQVLRTCSFLTQSLVSNGISDTSSPVFGAHTYMFSIQ